MAFHDTIIAVLQLFTIIMIGWLLANKAPASLIEIPKAFWGTLARLVYVLCAPALIFYSLARLDWKPEHWRFTEATVLGSLAAIGLTIALIGRISPSAATPTMRAISFQPNCVFLGFPLIAGVLSEHKDEAMALAAVFAGVEWPIVSIASITILRQGQKDDGTKKEKTRSLPFFLSLLRPFLTDPIVLGCAAGLTWSLTDLTIHSTIATPIRWLGDLTSPLALLIIGARLTFGSLHSHASRIVFISGLKLIAIPTLGWIVASIFSLPPVATAAYVLLIGTPVAASTIMLVERHEGDRELTANAISVSTVLSLITLTVMATLLV